MRESPEEAEESAKTNPPDILDHDRYRVSPHSLSNQLVLLIVILGWQVVRICTYTHWHFFEKCTYVFFNVRICSIFIFWNVDKIESRNNYFYF